MNEQTNLAETIICRKNIMYEKMGGLCKKICPFIHWWKNNENQWNANNKQASNY